MTEYGLDFETEEWALARTWEFTYTGVETTPSRYAQMINSFLMGTESSYYKYNWY